MKASTRAAVLTRAMDRIVGTVLGVVIGALVVVAVNHHVIPELILGVLCVFLASCFGSVRYTYLVVFITVMIAALFDLLGVFDMRLLVVRIEETVAGSLIGVVCAYLILSINSRPMLIDSIAKYFDALDGALACVATGLTTVGEQHQITDATDVHAALDRIRERARVTRAVLGGEGESAVDPAHIPVIALLARLNVEPDSSRGEAIVAASRLNQLLEDLDQTAAKAPDAAAQQ